MCSGVLLLAVIVQSCCSRTDQELSKHPLLSTFRHRLQQGSSRGRAFRGCCLSSVPGACLSQTCSRHRESVLPLCLHAFNSIALVCLCEDASIEEGSRTEQPRVTSHGQRATTTGRADARMHASRRGSDQHRNAVVGSQRATTGLRRGRPLVGPMRRCEHRAWGGNVKSQLCRCTFWVSGRVSVA
jgi:hypothetical protein